MRRLLYDLAALIARLVLGVVFIAHGWQKLSSGGIDATTAGFATMGVPMPRVAATFAILVELGGGILLLLGLLTPLVGFLIAVDMLGAFIFAHMGKGVFVSEGGFELVGALGSAALLLAAGGAGRFSLDHLIFGRRRDRLRETEHPPAYVPPIAAEPLPRISPATERPQPPQQPPTERPQPPPTAEQPQPPATERPGPPAPPSGPRTEPPDAEPPPR
ncbi:DoxX family protein [Streptosporangium roseum]|uniref:Membrane protein-like protein n=1 Tax=Streptosporangium roseum (strain ATCC 12428 / DSM 43021 / JCM 3005 / KCTC 9067 / NCIMB 10171 / NRRL 2505 / NI 9100) TaxID=479432 RepID=D2BCC3_STRRD|nr:DoxX family protein [Streptosporangium roseum]ACZ89952.1 membrane protein-like protein [Streptosporangium roseum DSM 43021]